MIGNSGEVDAIRTKLFEALDPNHPYTYEEFMAEFDSDNYKQAIDYSKIGLKFKNESDNQDPEYATAGSSGFDLRANLGYDENGNPKTMNILGGGGRAIVPTGLFFEIPENFEIQVRPRSGLAAKHGVTVLNTPGTVDADYRGEVKVILVNLGNEPFVIEHGERIAQAVVASVTAKNIIDLQKVDEIDENTERGAGGFGSTGTK